MKNRIAALMLVAGFFLTGCRSYRGYRTHVVETDLSTENETVADERQNIVLKNGNVIVKRQQTIDYTQNIKIDEYDDYIYVESSAVGPFFRLMFYPVTLCFSPLTLLTIESDTTRYKGNTYSYSSGRQIWNLFNPFLDYMSSHIDGRERDLDESYVEQEERRKKKNDEPAGLPLSVLCDGTPVMTGNTPLPLYDIHNVLFKAAFPEIQTNITIVAPKDKKTFIVKSTDFVSHKDLKEWKKIQNATGQEIIQNKTHFRETLKKWSDTKIISKKTEQSEQNRLLLLAKEYAKKEIQNFVSDEKALNAYIWDGDNSIIEKIADYEKDGILADNEAKEQKDFIRTNAHLSVIKTIDKLCKNNPVQNYYKYVADKNKIDALCSRNLISSQEAKEQKEKMLDMARKNALEYLHNRYVSFSHTTEIIRAYNLNLAEIDKLKKDGILTPESAAKEKGEIKKSANKEILAKFKNLRAVVIFDHKQNYINEINKYEAHNLLSKEESGKLRESIIATAAAEEIRLNSLLYPYKNKGIKSIALADNIMSGKSYRYRNCSTAKEIANQESRGLDCYLSNIEIGNLSFSGCESNNVYYACVDDTKHPVSFAIKKTVTGSEITIEDIAESFVKKFGILKTNTIHNKKVHNLSFIIVDLPYDYVETQRIVELSNPSVFIMLIDYIDGHVERKSGERLREVEALHDFAIQQAGMEVAIFSSEFFAEKVAKENGYYSRKDRKEVYICDRSILNMLLQKEEKQAKEKKQQEQKKLNNILGI